jgi:hypothetical protein
MIRPNQKSPVSLRLQPGDYLVVAELPDGSFHEVFRHVPEPEHSPAHTSTYPHRFWTRMPSGEIEIPIIHVPVEPVVAGMVQFAGSKAFVLGGETVPQTSRRGIPLPRPEKYHLPAYLLDATEVTHSAYERAGLPKGTRKASQIQEEFPVTEVSYDDAVYFAELAGKRLPTEAEYEFAATHGGTQAYSWDSITPPAGALSGVAGPVRGAHIDFIETEPRIWGLCSNVAEWTTSWPSNLHGLNAAASIGQPVRIVRGGSCQVVDGSLLVPVEGRGARLRTSVHWMTARAGLGFRCARSLQPRMNAQDFEARTVDEEYRFRPNDHFGENK